MRASCLNCHDPHGSTNLGLVRESLRWRRTVTQITFTSEQGAGAGGFTDPADPRPGLCEACHRHTDVYRRDLLHQLSNAGVTLSLDALATRAIDLRLTPVPTLRPPSAY